MAYHDNQPINDNMLRTCPILKKSEALCAVVKAAGPGMLAVIYGGYNR